MHAPGQVSVIPMKQTEEVVKPASLSAPVAMKKVVPEVDTPKDLGMMDEERSKNSMPLTIHQGDLGATSPARRATLRIELTK